MTTTTIIVDTREQRPYTFELYQAATTTATLWAGDYSLTGYTDIVSIERKSVDDLVNCLCHDRERFERELVRLGAFYTVAYVVAECSWPDLVSGSYRSAMRPSSVCQSVCTFMVRHGIPFLFAGDRRGGEYMTFSLLAKFARERGAAVTTLEGAQSCRVGHPGASCVEVSNA